MARKTALTSLSHISEINLTPLMDLTFILLITFVITFPLMEQGVSVNLPSGDADPLPEERTRTIRVIRSEHPPRDQPVITDLCKIPTEST